MPDARPNIVLIITDQQRYDTIRALGYDYMDTPSLDRLVNEGVSFSQCHVTAASCAPSRASLFLGQYPHTTGVLKNADAWPGSWVESLCDAGYHCVNMGKMHTWPYDADVGFDERYVVENKDRYLEGRYYFDEWDKALRARGLVKQQRELYRKRPDYDKCLGAFEWELPEDAHPDVFVGEFATWWLDNKPKPDGPLFLQVGFPGPHPPYDPVPRYAEPYLKRDLPMLPVTDEELASQPQAFKALRQHNRDIDHDSVVLDLNPTDEQRHRQRAYYLANVTMIDEQVGQIRAALERNGYGDNTVIVFTSDHGDCLTDHGHSQKWTMYDAVTRVPMIVTPLSAPGTPGEAGSPAAPFGPGFKPGSQVDALCQWMDIAPVILELAGVEPPDSFETESLTPALRGEPWAGRDYVFAEQVRDGILTDTAFMTMVRSRTHKLVHFLDEPEGQLFDLVTDPDELRNLWDDDAHVGVKQKLLDVLREWRVRSRL